MRQCGRRDHGLKTIRTSAYENGADRIAVRQLTRQALQKSTGGGRVGVGLDDR